MRMLYLIGVPGAGKSTLMALALEGVRRLPDGPPARMRCPGGVILGSDRPGHSGTDALPMNAQPAVLAYLATECPANVVGEGDRLGNGSFFEAVVAMGYKLTVVHLDAPKALAAARRKLRGTNQNPTWLLGRETKVERVASTWVAPRWRLDAGLPAEANAERLRAHPAIVGLRSELEG